MKETLTGLYIKHTGCSREVAGGCRERSTLAYCFVPWLNGTASVGQLCPGPGLGQAPCTPRTTAWAHRHCARRDHVVHDSIDVPSNLPVQSGLLRPCRWPTKATMLSHASRSSLHLCATPPLVPAPQRRPWTATPSCPLQRPGTGASSTTSCSSGPPPRCTAEGAGGNNVLVGRKRVDGGEGRASSRLWGAELRWRGGSRLHHAAEVHSCGSEAGARQRCGIGWTRPGCACMCVA